MAAKSIPRAAAAAGLLLWLFPHRVDGASPRQAEILINQIEANAIDIRPHADRIRTYMRYPGRYSSVVRR